MKKVILHIDIDSFFVSAEIANIPELKNKNVVVANPGNKSISLSLSYSIKNEGFNVPCKVIDIKKHFKNDLIVLNPNSKLYSFFSKRIFEYLKEKYNEIQIYSIDEWFIDITKFCKSENDVKNISKKIQNDILKEFNLPITIGISYNIFLAKTATNIAKPLGILFIKNKKDVKKYVWNKPIESYTGIGKATIPKLKKLNINTIGDLAIQNIQDQNIIDIFKNQTKIFIDNANGIGNDVLEIEQDLSKTISKTKTFKDGFVDDLEYIINVLKNLVNELWIIIQSRKSVINSFVIEFLDTDNFFKKKYNQKNYFENKNIFLRKVIEFFESFWEERAILKIGIVITKMESKVIVMNENNLFSDFDVNLISNERKIVNEINTLLNEEKLYLGDEVKKRKTFKS